MQKLFKLIRRWRYRRLFRRWYKYYAKKGLSNSEVFHNANEAFFWLSCCEYYPDWYAMEYYGVSLSDNHPSDQPRQCKVSDNRKDRHDIPFRYRDYYYLRDLDLHAERLADCPDSVCDEMADALMASGLLFETREKAEAARAVMLDAYSKTSRTRPIQE